MDDAYERLIILDTETTGLETKDGHRIIEIGCVEMIKRRMTHNNFHQYLQPDRAIDEEAQAVHGITPEFLADKPRFYEVADAFMEYIQGAELLIHNAAFDIGFLNYELELSHSRWGTIEKHCKVTDTLMMARHRYPGQRNSLDALCKRLGIDNSHRELHGALLDSQILGDVYLALTGGQRSLVFDVDPDEQELSDIQGEAIVQPMRLNQRVALQVIRADDEELRLHQQRVDGIRKQAGTCLWDEQ